jgi:hypothetical protein
MLTRGSPQSVRDRMRVHSNETFPSGQPASLNRDQIVLLTFNNKGLSLVTTLGATICVSGPRENLNELIDRFINAVGANFVEIAEPSRLR